MTISEVQANGAASGNVTLGSDVAAGNSVIVFGWMYATSNISLAASIPTLGGSSVPGASLLLSEQSPYDGSLTVNCLAWLLPDCPAGQDAIAYTPTSGNANDIAAFEFSGLGTSPVLDQQAGGQGTGTAVASGTTGSITAAPELILGIASSIATMGSGPGGGWTSSGIGNGQWCGYQIVTSSGGTYSWSQTGNSSDAWAAGVVTIAAGIPFLAPPNRPRGQAVNRASTY